MSLPKIGQKAPEFSLENQNGEKVSLKDYKGKVIVLYFYPKASTPGCTIQAQGIRDHKAEFEALNAVVLGVSYDPVKRIKNFEVKQELSFELLADEDQAVTDLYGIWQLKQFMGKEKMGVVRTTFIIDEEGQVEDIYMTGKEAKTNGVDKDHTFKTKDHHEIMLAHLKAR
ncbi:MAG: thioredoxin-dependent thiol peroxidase [Pseudomonadales bacterium]|nr:thioredoxin-dependent thiol peroxidase [Pseudomonadales bacterium]